MEMGWAKDPYARLGSAGEDRHCRFIAPSYLFEFREDIIFGGSRDPAQRRLKAQGESSRLRRRPKGAEGSLSLLGQFVATRPSARRTAVP
jgi:hypothetical protein